MTTPAPTMMTESTAMSNSVPAKKRKFGEDSEQLIGSAQETVKKEDSIKVGKQPGMSKAREIRLEQNRKVCNRNCLSWAFKVQVLRTILF